MILSVTSALGLVSICGLHITMIVTEVRPVTPACCVCVRVRVCVIKCACDLLQDYSSAYFLACVGIRNHSPCALAPLLLIVLLFILLQVAPFSHPFAVTQRSACIITAVPLQVVPFLVLALGVDNMFLLVRAFDSHWEGPLRPISSPFVGGGYAVLPPPGERVCVLCVCVCAVSNFFLRGRSYVVHGGGYAMQPSTCDRVHTNHILSFRTLVSLLPLPMYFLWSSSLLFILFSTSGGATATAVLDIPTAMSHAMAEVGPTITAAAVSEVLALGVGESC